MNKHQQPSKTWNDIFDYKDGVLFWKEKSPGRKSNGIAGCTCKQSGYVKLSYNGKAYQAHRIVWEMFNSPIPKGMQIDHINGDKKDNRISNLRIVTNQDNHKNMPKAKNNVSGVTGVYVPKKGKKKYVANIKKEGRTHYIGTYATLESAALARKEAEINLNYHQNHGRNVI